MMDATVIPWKIECICGQPMQTLVTDKICKCLNNDCPEKGKEYELPVQTVTLTEKP